METKKEISFLRAILRERPFAKKAFPDAQTEQGALSVVWADIAGRDRLHQPETILPAAATSRLNSRKRNGNWQVLNRRKAASTAKIDVLILCPLSKELNPTLAVFRVNPDRATNFIKDHGRRIYFHTLKYRRAKLVIAIAAVGMSRNAPCAIGMGGGVKSKVQQGDVVMSTAVIDIAGGRLQPGGEGRRDKRLEISPTVQRLLDHFENRIQRDWKRIVRAELIYARRKKLFNVIDRKSMVKGQFDIQAGIIVAGEKLVADGSLPSKIVKKRDDRILSVEQEGSGFAQACVDNSTEWMVFRGIADYGDPRKKKVTDRIWQPTAALAAALAIKCFVQHELFD